MMSKIFSEKLKEYRKELEIKRSEKVGQVKLAEELGISNGAIGNLESGTRLPSKSILVKIAEHSGKPLDYWMEGISGYEPPNTLDLVLDTMIAEGLITDLNLSDDVWEIIKKAVLLEVERRLY